MNQHTGTGLPPVHHDTTQARYALTAAGHGALAPTGTFSCALTVPAAGGCPMTAEQHKPPATCARGARAIDAGEPHVVITLQWERMRRKRITVRHAQALAYVHEDCTEGLTEQVANALAGVGGS